MEKKEQRKTINLRDILVGSFFLNKKVSQWSPVLILLFIIGLIMISSRYTGEKTLRELVKFQDSLTELRSESVTIEAELTRLSRVSEVLRRSEEYGLGLARPTTPPGVIYFDVEK